MHDYSTIIGIIDMRERHIGINACRSRYGIGCSGLYLIMNRFKESGLSLEELKQMSPEAVENLFYPPENLRKKDESDMPDFQAIYNRLHEPGSRVSMGECQWGRF